MSRGWFRLQRLHRLQLHFRLRFLVSTREIQISSIKNLVLSLHTGLHLGVLLLLLGLQLCELLLQDHRVHRLLLQDQGRYPLCTRREQGGVEEYPQWGLTQVFQVTG